MMTKAIVFASNLAHVLGFRHGPRAARPPAGNVWDYWQMVHPEKGPADARRVVKTYFLDLVPYALRCSQIPRSAQSLGLLWPILVPQIKLDRRLAFEFEDLHIWAPSDQYPNAYDMTPQEMHAIQPGLVDECGQKFMSVARDLAELTGIGHVATMCSHVPYADAGARAARLELGITENGGWLPGSGFGSGAFVHLVFTVAGKLAHCEYYPVPTE